MDWIHLPHGTDKWWNVVNAVKNTRFSLNAGNFLESSGPPGFSRTLLHPYIVTVEENQNKELNIDS
jgi:hypothetical protein